MIDYHVLGSVRVARDGEEVSVGGARQRRLLAMLLLHRNEVVSTDRLAEAVFAGEPTPAAATTLRSYDGERLAITGVTETADGISGRIRILDRTGRQSPRSASAWLGCGRSTSTTSSSSPRAASPVP